MLYLLGGIPRAGKSIIARKMLWEMKIPYFSLDYLMDGIGQRRSSLGVDPMAPLDTTGEKLWPLVKEICISIINVGIDYVIEGAQLLRDSSIIATALSFRELKLVLSVMLISLPIKN